MDLRGSGAISFLLAACSDGLKPLVPEFGESPLTSCNEDSGIRICIEKVEYAPSELVEFTVANSLNRFNFLNRCSGGVAGRRRTTDDWGSSYGTSRTCTFYDPREDYYANMLPLPRCVGSSSTPSTPNSLAFDGDWRVWVLELDWRAFAVRDEWFTSAVFRVRP